jgi:hypothetical protein
MMIDNMTASPLIVNESDNVTLKCQAHGRPTPYVAWLRHHDDESNDLLLMNNTDGLFQLINIDRRQGGHYECRVSNGVNDHVISKDIELRVLCK